MNKEFTKYMNKFGLDVQFSVIRYLKEYKKYESNFSKTKTIMILLKIDTDYLFECYKKEIITENLKEELKKREKNEYNEAIGLIKKVIKLNKSCNELYKVMYNILKNELNLGLEEDEEIEEICNIIDIMFKMFNNKK